MSVLKTSNEHGYIRPTAGILRKLAYLAMENRLDENDEGMGGEIADAIKQESGKILYMAFITYRDNLMKGELRREHWPQSIKDKSKYEIEDSNDVLRWLKEYCVEEYGKTIRITTAFKHFKNKNPEIRNITQPIFKDNLKNTPGVNVDKPKAGDPNYAIIGWRRKTEAELMEERKENGEPEFEHYER